MALDARTGRLLWEVQIADSMLGHNITSPPLVVKDKVIVGMAGGEFGSRGFLDAYDAATGKRAVALLHDSRPGRVRQRHLEGRQLEEGRLRRLADGTFDPELNSLYWPVGNPAPQIDRSVRGDGRQPV